MMKKVMISMFAVSVLLLLNSFVMADAPKEDIRKLDAFSGIGISVSADVYYTPGNTHEIRIEGDARDVDDLITKVKDGFLQVKYDDWRKRHSKLTIYITSTELEAVKISGSAQFNSKEAISSDEMALAMSGSGDILFEKLTADEVEVRISGSGDIELFGGSADEMDVRISGSGKVNAETFEVDEFSVGISGSGGVRVTVKDDLDAKISGSGKVYYHGSPRVNSSSSGSGKVVSL
jgi:hypothetical protein